MTTNLLSTTFFWRTDVVLPAWQPTLPVAPFAATLAMAAGAQLIGSYRMAASARRTLDVRTQAMARVAGGTSQFEARTAPAIPEGYELYRARERQKRDVWHDTVNGQLQGWLVGEPAHVPRPFTVQAAVGRAAHY